MASLAHLRLQITCMYPLSAIALRLVFFNHVTVAVCHATRRLLDMKSLAIMSGQLSYIKPVHTLAASNTRVLEQSKMRLLSLSVADGEGERKRERERETEIEIEIEKETVAKRKTVLERARVRSMRCMPAYR